MRKSFAYGLTIFMLIQPIFVGVAVTYSRGSVFDGFGFRGPFSLSLLVAFVALVALITMLTVDAVKKHRKTQAS